MGRGGSKKVIEDLLAQGIKEQFPNGETYTPPTNELIQTELLVVTNKVGGFFELRKKPILTRKITGNVKIIKRKKGCYMIVTKFDIPKELPVPESWF